MIADKEFFAVEGYYLVRASQGGNGKKRSWEAWQTNLPDLETARRYKAAAEALIDADAYTEVRMVKVKVSQEVVE